MANWYYLTMAIFSEIIATSSLKFESYDGGRDSKERLTQGLMVALDVASPRTLIVVFTDNGSKDLFLEDEIVKLRERKQCEVRNQS